MSSSNTNFDALGSPTPKRFRTDSTSLPCSAALEDTDGPKDQGKMLPESVFLGPTKRRPFNNNNALVDDYVVNEARRASSLTASSAANSCRHLCSPPYAIAAVTHTNDPEMLNNGDSGFQELNVPDEISAEIGDNDFVSNGITQIEVPNESDNQAEEGEGDSPLDNGIDDDNLSELSCGSNLSSMSGENWKPISNNIKWVHMQMQNGTNPKELIRQLTGDELPEEVDELAAWRIIIRILSEPSIRPKLTHINTIEHVIELIERSSKIIVLTGAGVSVSCGIPDFRSRNGIYARLSKDYPDLPDPQSMFDISYFRRNPFPFFKFAKEIYPGQFSPSPSHKFIRYIERKGKLLRNYSQNIDTLEQAAGIEKVITCHGSFATATCTKCGYKVDSNAIKEDIFAQLIPLCPKCVSDHMTTEDDSIMPGILPVMKPDIVFFGEGLSDEFHNSMTLDKDDCDLLIVIGSSLKVRPVALIPSSIPENVPQILINREPLSHLNFDVELLGDCDIIVKHLCERLGQEWTDFCFKPSNTIQTTAQTLDKNVFEFIEPSRYIFAGAELNETSSSESDNEDSDCDEDSSQDFAEQSISDCQASIATEDILAQNVVDRQEEKEKEHSFTEPPVVNCGTSFLNNLQDVTANCNDSLNYNSYST